MKENKTLRCPPCWHKCLILNIFLFILSLCITISDVLAFGGSSKASQRTVFSGGVDAIGIHMNGPEIAAPSTKTIYCEHTDAVGDCTSWAECPYESSEDKIVGVPWADGGCATDANHRVVCLDTNLEGICDGWGEPCLKTEEYHEIIGTPMARSFCCEPGTAHCDHYNDNNQCVHWDCHHTCSSENAWQYCNKFECAALGGHFTFDTNYVNGCRCKTGYTGENCDDCVEPSYIKDINGNCVLNCDEAHAGDYCLQCAEGYRETSDQPEGAGFTTPRNCELNCSTANLTTCKSEECEDLGPRYTYSQENGCVQLECVSNGDCGEYEVCEGNKCVSKCDDDEFADLSGTCFKCTEEDQISSTRTQCENCGEKRLILDPPGDEIVTCFPKPTGCVMTGDLCTCPEGTTNVNGVCTSNTP